MTTNMRPSSFHTGLTIQGVADQKVDALIASARAGTLAEDEAYGSARRRVVQYTLEGGGPGADIMFVLDSEGDVTHAVYTYMEMDGHASVPLEPRAADLIFKGLNTPASEDDDEDADD